MAKIASPLRMHYNWSSMTVNAHERALVTNERTRFELEIGPLVDQLRGIRQEFGIMRCEKRYLEDWKDALVAKLREHGMDIPLPKYHPAQYYGGGSELS